MTKRITLFTKNSFGRRFTEMWIAKCRFKSSLHACSALLTCGGKKIHPFTSIGRLPMSRADCRNTGANKHITAHPTVLSRVLCIIYSGYVESNKSPVSDWKAFWYHVPIIKYNLETLAWYQIIHVISAMATHASDWGKWKHAIHERSPREGVHLLCPYIVINKCMCLESNSPK